jgi:anti-sigma B factor antagonist
MLTTDQSVPGAVFELDTTTWGTTRTISCTGEFDLAVEADFSAAVEGAIAAEPETVVIDLSGLAFIDSTGIHGLLRAHGHAQARGVRLVIVPAPERVHRVFGVCGLDARLPFVTAVRRDGADDHRRPGAAAERLQLQRT